MNNISFLICVSNDLSFWCSRTLMTNSRTVSWWYKLFFNRFPAFHKCHEFLFGVNVTGNVRKYETDSCSWLSKS